MKKRTRIELHCHTKMSENKGLIEPSELVRYANDNGYKAIAITDCNSVQAFPEVYNTWKKLWCEYEEECNKLDEEAKKEDFLKIIYGMEAFITDDFSCSEENLHSLMDECTVIDIETTGFSASKDAILRIDAVKVKDGKQGDRFSSYVLQEREIPEYAIKITGISEDDLKDAKPEERVITDLISFIGKSFLVMYDADFEMKFIKKACEKYGINFEPDYVDLYKICMYLSPSETIKKTQLVEKYMIKEDSNDNDCTLYAKIYNAVCERLKNRAINSIGEVNYAINKNFIKSNVKKNRVKGKQTRYPVLLYAKNDTGIRNLYKIVTEARLGYRYHESTIPRWIIDKYRDGILVGAVCDGGEVMTAIHTELGSRSEAEYRRDFSNILSYYDFIEVSPFRTDKDNDVSYMYNVVNNGGLLVAASDAYYLCEEDKLYWDILTNGRNEKYSERPRQLMKWDEISKPFDCWVSGDPEILKEIPQKVIESQSVIAEQIEYVSPLRDGAFMPTYPDAEQKLRNICETRLKELFGEKTAREVRDRLYRELEGICQNGYAGLFMMWRDIAEKSIEKGYLHSSRGSVASSFVAFLCGITEINPLASEYGGYDIPVETFLGINLDKKPDIDMNFAPAVQELLQNYVKEIPGVGDTCHGGTVGTLTPKTAQMHVEEYYYHKGLPLPSENLIKEQAEVISGVKGGDGCHPGGIIVSPVGEDLLSFTPLQHPWNSGRITTHFEYHAIMDNLLKLDILGYEPLGLLHELEKLTDVKAKDIPMDDPIVLEMLCNLEIEEINDLPVFGCKSARQMIIQTAPKSIDDLIKVSCLMHGTDVWLDNQDELFKNKVISLKDCVASRDDIFLTLVNMGMNKEDAYNIMESVRKGKGLTEKMKQKLSLVGMPEWFIGVCEKIRYLFPKAHSASYTLVAWRLAYYKVYYPENFECAIKLVNE